VKSCHGWLVFHDPSQLSKSFADQKLKHSISLPSRRHN
jgi:hypothetical protein